MLNQSKILAISPWVEVAIRLAYWKIPFLHTLLAKFVSGKSHETSPSEQKLNFDEVIDGLRSLGLREGDLLVLHSSGKALKPFGLSPDEVLNYLSAACGPTGTLALPAIRIFGSDVNAWQRMRTKEVEVEEEYNPRTTPVWTGILAKTLLARSDAVVSRHPINSMVAVGERAHAMMASNLEGAKPTGCGRGSSWKYCADHNALIVFLGVDAAHNMTMIHVAEDAWEDEWPFRAAWYRARRFRVIDRGLVEHVTVRERRPKWAMFYAERTLQRDLLNAGLLKRFSVGPVEVQAIRSADLISFLRVSRWKGYPYKVPFWI
jgi:aminoglycoside 3-N-acetyltransferase